MEVVAAVDYSEVVVPRLPPPAFYPDFGKIYRVNCKTPLCVI